MPPQYLQICQFQSISKNHTRTDDSILRILLVFAIRWVILCNSL